MIAALPVAAATAKWRRDGQASTNSSPSHRIGGGRLAHQASARPSHHPEGEAAEKAE